MDKFINKECDSNIGVNLISINNRVNKNEQSIEYKLILENFKNILNKKIHNFDPLANDSKDYYNNIIKSMWFYYICKKTTQKSYNELFEYLNIVEH